MRGMSLPRLSLAFVLSLAVLAGFGGLTASAAVQSRIQVAVSNNSRTEVAKSVHPKASLASDLGATPGNTKLQGMAIHFTRTDAQEEALDQLLADLQNPASPQYHQWLTPTQFAAQFGLSAADLSTVKNWLISQGFSVTGTANGGSFITFDGTVAQAQTAFSTSIHNLSLNGETHFANVTNISVPSALSGVVEAVTGLHNFRLKPHLRTSPRYTSSVSQNHYLAPGDIYTIYNMNPLLTSGITGVGMTIAVMGQVDISTADVSAFRAASGLSTSNLPTTVHEGGDPGTPTCTNTNCNPNDGDIAESSIDVEWAGAMAPSASILFVNGPDVLFNATTQTIDQNLAPIITLSYGNCEAAWGSTDLNSFNSLFKQANAQGQTILAATGDVGATDCDAGTSALEGLTVDFPASSPYVTGMGGTMFNDGSATGATTYWSATNGTTGGSATGYIPEVVWNEDTAGSTFSAGGGGISAFFPKPAWQVEAGAPGMTTTVPADSSRDVPDLALDAAAGHDQYLYCAQGYCVTGYRYTDSTLDTAGGTSFDSQIFGGMLALIEQKIGGRIGNANPTIYALANNTAFYNTTGTSVFHDITSGNNSNPCTAGTPNCPSGGTIGYSAAVGYDLTTGWGTVNVANLANDWNLVTPLGVGLLGTSLTTTALTASSTSVTPGTNVTLTATVTATSGGTPTGTVQFLVNNIPAGTPVAISGGGVATYTFIASCSTPGQQNMTAVYSGDATFAGSKGPALSSAEAGQTGGANTTSNGTVVTNPLIVNVSTGTCPTFVLAPSGTGVTVSGSTGTVSVAAGGTIPAVTITATPANNFTGTVVFSATSTSTSGYTPTLTFSPASVTLTSAATATTTLTFSGITANMRMPNVPGHVARGVELARNGQGKLPWKMAGSGVTIASLLLLILPRRRRLGGLLLVLFSVVLIGGASGCGGSSQTVVTSTSNSNPYAGTYQVTVVGTYAVAAGQTTKQSAVITYIIN